MVIIQSIPIVTKSCDVPDELDRYHVWKIQYDRLRKNAQNLGVADSVKEYLQELENV
jgi:hypothetical protein